MSVHFGGFNYNQKNPNANAEKITIFRKSETYYVQVSSRLTRQYYTVTWDNGGKYWKVFNDTSTSEKGISVGGEMRNSLTLRLKEKKERRIIVFAFLATVASIAGLAGKSFGWINVGHSGLYGTAAVISLLVVIKFGVQLRETCFQMANSIHSIAQCPTPIDFPQAIVSKLLLNPADYGFNKKT
jgi:hypothetical protein